MEFTRGAVLEVICNGGLSAMVFGDVYKWCRQPIRLEIDRKGNLKSATKIINSESPSQVRKNTKLPSINIGNVFGNVAFGDSASIVTNIYNVTIQAINEAKHIDQEKKTQAKSILEHVKTFAPPFLPIIADVIKKTLAL